MKKAYVFIGAVLGLFIIFSSGCQDVINDQGNDGQGRLLIKLTDAPFPIDMIDSATVYISKVEVRKFSDGEQEGYPFITVLEEPVEFNLLDLRNGVMADLVNLEIEAGSYDLIRLYVEDASLKVKEGEKYSIKVPSGQQTGIKIFMEPALEVVGGLTTDVLLDFSVEKSFILKGNYKTPAGIKGFNFKPVIRAVNMTTTGTIEGVVDYSDTLQKDVSVWIELDTVITSAFTDTVGYYAMPGIPAGFYTVSAAKEGFDTIAVEGVEIVAGNLTVQNFTLTPAGDTEEE